MFARTPRLLLRPGWIEDAPALAAAIGEERIVRNLARAPWPYGVADAEACLERTDAALPSFLIFARGEHPPELVGGIGFDATQENEVELSCWIASRCWNRGYATEAGRAALTLAREGLRLCRVTAGHFFDNPASGRVLEKLGFESASEVEHRYSRARGTDVPFQPYLLNLREAGRGEPERLAA